MDREKAFTRLQTFREDIDRKAKQNPLRKTFVMSVSSASELSGAIKELFAVRHEALTGRDAARAEVGRVIGERTLAREAAHALERRLAECAPRAVSNKAILRTLSAIRGMLKSLERMIKTETADDA